jgi:hypothetical protein
MRLQRTFVEHVTQLFGAHACRIKLVVSKTPILRASPVAFPKLSPKAIWGVPDQKNGFSRVPQTRILSGAPRYGVRRPTGDAPGTPDTPKSEAGSGGADPSASQ